MFSQACVKNLVHRGVCVSQHALPGNAAPPPGHARPPPPGTHAPRILRDAINERAARILLECILVFVLFS